MFLKISLGMPAAWTLIPETKTLSCDLMLGVVTTFLAGCSKSMFFKTNCGTAHTLNCLVQCIFVTLIHRKHLISVMCERGN